MNNSTASLTEKNIKSVKKVVKRATYIIVFLVLTTVLVVALMLRQAKDVHSAKTIHDQSKALLVKQKEADILLNKYQGEDKKLSELYPDKRSIVKFVDDIEKLGNLYGTGSEFNFEAQSPLKDSNSYLYLPFTVTFTGELSGLLSFLENYETIAYLASISNVEVKGITGIEGTGTYIIKGRIYVSDSF